MNVSIELITTPVASGRGKKEMQSYSEKMMTMLGAGLLIGAFSIGTGLFSCAGNVDEDVDGLMLSEQAIYFGTRSPSVTNLSAGEQLAIGFLADASGSPFCTATLIDNDVAVTAQHCVVNTEAVENMRFGMGDPNNPSALLEVHSAPFHDDLDVALLLLKDDALSWVPSAEPIPFLRQEPSQSWIGTDVEAAGFGATHDDSTGLYFVTVELTGIQSELFVVNGHGQRGICFGDSGGPLFVNADTGDPIIIGVESHGDASCVDEDFETRLDQAVTWIDGEMEAFDPNSAPQTGTQSDGTPDWDDAGIPFCTTSPNALMGQFWLVMLLGLTGLALVARRRYPAS